jgi:purine-binding chemotaxis protein CheW
MTQYYSYLIFRIHNSLYGVSTLSVKEIFLLPELTPILEAPPGIVGVIDVRGHIVPVMDLNLRFGQQIERYSLTDQIIVLEQEEQDLGIIVDEVFEVRNIPATDIVNLLKDNQPASNINSHQFIAGMVRSENELLVIINLANLLKYISEPNYGARQGYLQQQFPVGFLPGNNQQPAMPKDQLIVVGGESIAVNSLANSSTQLTSEALTIMRERADRLRQLNQVRQNADQVKNLAIVVLNQELFSIDLENVREFTNIEQVVPVPCCPPHIVGNMNLRGEILTLIDICQVLNLPSINLRKISQLMVVEVDNLRVGLAIEKVYDTISVDLKEIDLVPAASYSTNKEYFQGTLSYQKNMVSILNIAKILQNENLVVDQSG